jgi:glyoxylase-like metal-dependent hydrolase (beta-lactamase superfamily II)
MHQIEDYIYLLELQPPGIRGFLSAYILRGEKVAIIDPGPTVTVDSLVEELKALGVDQGDVRYVAVTHIHIDHAGGAGKLLKHLPNAILLVHGRGAPHMIEPTRLWRGARKVLGDLAELYGEVEPVPRDRIVVGRDGTILDLGMGIRLKVLETPGHASHAMSFYDGKSRGIFTGDAAGLYLAPPGVVLPSTPYPFFLDSALTSLDRMIALRPERIYYAHFGFSGEGVRRLERYKEQLNLWLGIIAESMEAGLDVSEIYKKIEKKDENIKAAKEALDRNWMFKDNLILSIEGFLRYLHRIGSSAP